MSHPPCAGRVVLVDTNRTSRGGRKSVRRRSNQSDVWRLVSHGRDPTGSTGDTRTSESGTRARRPTDVVGKSAYVD